MTNPKFALPVGSVLFSLLLTGVCIAQPPGDSSGWGGRFMGSFGGSTMGLLNSEQVQSELELMEDQIEELRAVQQSAQQAMRDMFSEMQDIPREERREFMSGMRDKLTERMKEFDSEANQILLPHQQSRLKQLRFQSSGRGRGAGGALGNEDLLEELGVTDEQREELEEATAEAREKLQKQYQDLVREAEQNILKVLTSEQRKKYEELVGEPFEFQSRGRFSRGGPERGDRGSDRDRGDDRRRGDNNRSDFR